MRAVIEPALAYVRGEIDKIVLQTFLADLVYHFHVKRGETRSIGYKCALAEVIELDMPCRVLPASKTLAHLARLDVLGELAVARLVVRLDFGDLAELEGDVGKALGLGLLGHAPVHLGPLLMLAGGGGEQVLRRGADAREELEPHLRVLLLVQRRLLEYGRDLFVAVLLRLRGEVVVLVARLRFTRKGRHQVLFRLGSLEFHCLPSFFLFSVGWAL